MKITKFALEWKPQDMWVGLFWRTTHALTDEGVKPFATEFWLCLLPMLPLHVVVCWDFDGIPF